MLAGLLSGKGRWEWVSVLVGKCAQMGYGEREGG